MIVVHVRFFGPARDFGVPEVARLEMPDGARVADVRAALIERFERLREALPNIRMAVNEAFADDDRVLADGDEVALIPPVSGGSAANDDTWIELVRESIAMDRAHVFVLGEPRCGGIATFVGATRAETDETHGALVRLEYEAYESMAVSQLGRLAAEAKSRWSPGRMAILHRLGAVAPGEASVVIAVACAHRAEAFDACRWLIDALKRDVPIWKRDVYADGFARWVDPAANGAADRPDTTEACHREAT